MTYTFILKYNDEIVDEINNLTEEEKENVCAYIDILILLTGNKDASYEVIEELCN